MVERAPRLVVVVRRARLKVDIPAEPDILSLGIGITPYGQIGVPRSLFGVVDAQCDLSDGWSLALEL